MVHGINVNYYHIMKIGDDNMIKKHLKKSIALGILAISILAINPIGASAEWKQTSRGWCFIENGSYATGWKHINGNWYYFSEYGSHEAVAGGKQYLDGAMYSFDSNGAMQTGWVENVDNWSYYYSNGKMAVNTVIDGYVIGPGGCWDRNPEYTPEQALEIAKKKYGNDPDAVVTVSPNFEYKNGKKYFLIHLASKGAQAHGGTGTIGNYHVYADGRIEEQ